jgi:hypothetical protein
MDIPADHYLTPSKTRTRTTHSKKKLQYITRTDTLKFSFFVKRIYNPINGKKKIEKK